VADEADIDAAACVIRHNLPVLAGFQGIVVATNYADLALADANHAMWRSFFPDAVLLDSPLNRGHSIGTADLENLLLEYCRSAGRRWLCKGANDIVLDPAVARIPVHEAQFFFLNAVAYAAVHQHGRASFGAGFFFPQTTFFAVEVDAVDYLYDAVMLDESWQAVQAIPDYSGKIWEYLPGWSCERWLRECVLRNGLTRCHLMSPTQWQAVLDVVIAERIEDCSFKGLTLNGITHGWPRGAHVSPGRTAAGPRSSSASPAPPSPCPGSTTTRSRRA
jgi:hypothetical protein